MQPEDTFADCGIEESQPAERIPSIWPAIILLGFAALASVSGAIGMLVIHFMHVKGH